MKPKAKGSVVLPQTLVAHLRLLKHVKGESKLFVGLFGYSNANFSIRLGVHQYPTVYSLDS